MPVVSRNQIGFEGRTIIREIRVNSQGLFSCSLPLDVAEMLGTQSVGGNTLAQCETAWQDAMKKYKTLKTTERKVILYEINASAQIVRGGKCVFSKDQMHFEDGCAMAVCAMVAMEKTIAAANGSKRFEYVHVKDSKLRQTALHPRIRDTFSSRGERIESQLEWTQEREDFFVKLAVAMESIVLELEKLDTPETINSIIAAGGFKMLPPSK